MSSIIYTSYSQLPLTLNADQVAAVLSISRANAYALMHSKGSRRSKSASAWWCIGIS